MAQRQGGRRKAPAPLAGGGSSRKLRPGLAGRRAAQRPVTAAAGGGLEARGHYSCQVAPPAASVPPRLRAAKRPPGRMAHTNERERSAAGAGRGERIRSGWRRALLRRSAPRKQNTRSFRPCGFDRRAAVAQSKHGIRGPGRVAGGPRRSGGAGVGSGGAGARAAAAGHVGEGGRAARPRGGRRGGRARTGGRHAYETQVTMRRSPVVVVDRVDVAVEGVVRVRAAASSVRRA